MLYSWQLLKLETLLFWKWIWIANVYHHCRPTLILVAQHWFLVMRHWFLVAWQCCFPVLYWNYLTLDLRRMSEFLLFLFFWNYLTLDLRRMRKKTMSFLFVSNLTASVRLVSFQQSICVTDHEFDGWHGCFDERFWIEFIGVQFNIDFFRRVIVQMKTDEFDCREMDWYHYRNND